MTVKKASFASKPPLHGLTFVTDKWLSPLPKVRHCVRSSDTESICGRHHLLLKLARSISTLWITSNLSYFYESQTTGIYFQCKSIYWYLCCTFSSWILHQGLNRRLLQGTNEPLSYWGLCTVVQYQHNLVCYWYVFNNRGRKDYSSQYLSSRTK